jgi:hypothetical protein
MQWCLPLRRQHDAGALVVSAKVSGATKLQASTPSMKLDRTRRILGWNACTSPAYVTSKTRSKDGHDDGQRSNEKLKQAARLAGGRLLGNLIFTDPNLETLSQVRSRLCWLSTRNRFHSSIASPSASTGCSGTSSQCASKLRPGRDVNSPMSLRRWSSTRRSLKASWRLQNISPGPSTTSTSIRSMRNFDRARSGVCPTRSHRHSRKWIQSLNSGRLRSWESFWRLGSRTLSKHHMAVPAGPPLFG